MARKTLPEVFLITKNLLSAKTGKTCGCAMIGYLIKFIYEKKKTSSKKRGARGREREKAAKVKKWNDVNTHNEINKLKNCISSASEWSEWDL